MKTRLMQWLGIIGLAIGIPGSLRAAEGVGARYATEWVWMISVHDRQLDRLAQELTEKYRQSLNLPEGKSLDVRQWLDVDKDLEWKSVIPGRDKAATQVDAVVPASQCLAAARAEFTSRRQALEAALAQSLANWTQTVSKRDASSVAAIWQAAADLRFLAVEKDSLPGALSSLPRQLTAAGVKAIETAVGQFFGMKPDFGDATVVEKLLGKAWNKGADEAENYVSELLTTQFQLAMGGADPKALENLRDSLIRWADVMVDEVAYPRPRPATDYRGLGSNVVFQTGYAVALAPDLFLAKAFGTKTIRVAPAGVPTEVELSVAEMEKLARGEKLTRSAAGGGAVGVVNIGAADIPQFTNWLKDLKGLQTQAAELGAKGQQVFDSRVSGEDPLLALSAMRVLITDLRKINADDTLTPEIRKYVMKKVVSGILKNKANPYSAALGVFVSDTLDEAVDFLLPDKTEEFLKKLERQSLSRGPGAGRLPLVAPQGEASLAELVKPSPKLPASCGGKEEPSKPAAVVAAGEVVWVLDKTEDDPEKLAAKDLGYGQRFSGVSRSGATMNYTVWGPCQLKFEIGGAPPAVLRGGDKFQMTATATGIWQKPSKDAPLPGVTWGCNIGVGGPLEIKATPHGGGFKIAGGNEGNHTVAGNFGVEGKTERQWIENDSRTYTITVQKGTAYDPPVIGCYIGGFGTFGRYTYRQLKTGEAIPESKPVAQPPLVTVPLTTLPPQPKPPAAPPPPQSVGNSASAAGTVTVLQPDASGPPPPVTIFSEPPKPPKPAEVVPAPSGPPGVEPPKPITSTGPSETTAGTVAVTPSRREGTSAAALLTAGDVYAGRSEWEKAYSLYRDAVGAAPNDARARAAAGKALMQLGRADLAKDQLFAAANLEPTNQVFVASMAEALLASGDRQQALLWAKQAIALGLKQHKVFDQLGLKP